MRRCGEGEDGGEGGGAARRCGMGKMGGENGGALPIRALVEAGGCPTSPPPPLLFPCPGRGPQQRL